jgi:hypothetical protein
MSRTIRARFRVEVGLCFLSLVLLVVTLIWRDWIEVVFRVDPDAGSGSLEWFVAVGCGAAALILAVVSSREWRQSTRLEGASGPSRA